MCIRDWCVCVCRHVSVCVLCRVVSFRGVSCRLMSSLVVPCRVVTVCVGVLLFQGFCLFVWLAMCGYAFDRVVSFLFRVVALSLMPIWRCRRRAVGGVLWSAGCV